MERTHVVNSWTAAAQGGGPEAARRRNGTLIGEILVRVGLHHHQHDEDDNYDDDQKVTLMMMIMECVGDGGDLVELPGRRKREG